MHPRTILRREITELLRETLPADAFVAEGRARDVPTSSQISALVYTPAESVRQEPTSDRSPNRPAARLISLVIVIQTKAAGDGSEAMDQADALSRDVERAINSSQSQDFEFFLVRTESGVSAAKDVLAEVILTYDVDHFDAE